MSVVITTVLIWPFLGRILNQSLLGELSLHFAIASILAPALCLGAHLYLANRMASGREIGIAVEARTAVTLTTALYAFSLLMTTSSFIFEFSNVLMSIGLSAAVSAYLVTSGVMRGIDRPRSFAFFAFSVQVIGLAGLGLAAAATEELRTGILAYDLMIGIPVAAQYLLLRHQLIAVRWRSITTTLVKSASLVPHLVLAVALLMMMRVLVSIQLGNQAAANYTFASLIIGGSLTVGASLDAHWSVRAQASKTVHSLSSVLSRNQHRIQIILLAASAGVALFLFFGLDLWLPAGYDSAGVRVAVICAIPAASLQALADGRAAVLMWTNSPALVSLSTSLGTLVTVALAYFLLPSYGWPVIGIALTGGLLVRTIIATLSTRLVCADSRVGALNYVILFVQFIFASTLFAIA
ncbi:hypothetical protein [Arthrobacter sp. 92]|uniref:hypothetical protein n=1 Tax=Arthrobacter sp. 92 TaxID=3418175 RepID=UPI003D0679A5